jgi:two-component system, LytTR family, sensor kinase
MNFISTLIYSKNKGVRILRHVLFWVANLVSYLAITSSGTELEPVVVFGLISRLALVAGVVYLIFLYLIPRYSEGKHLFELVGWTLAIMLFIGVGIPYLRYYVINPLLWPECPAPSNPFFFGSILAEIFNWMAVICTAIAIKVTKTKNELQQKAGELLNEKRRAELSFLKAQMHPHFLFNTLNTLYLEAINTDTRSEQIVLRLSNLMRFILEECNKPLIPLKKEIQVIHDYIELEKIRHGSRLQVDFQNDVTDATVLVSPLLLLPFVENSFKHTLSRQPGMIPIAIRISSDGEYILLRVENNIAEKTGDVVSRDGMGIRNVRKQLELLFGQNYKLDISANGKYIVNLSVPSVTV